MSLIENYIVPALYRPGRYDAPFYCREGNDGRFCYWKLQSTAGDFLGMSVMGVALSKLLISAPDSLKVYTFYALAGIMGAVSTIITAGKMNAEIPFDVGIDLMTKSQISLTGFDVAAVALLALAVFCECTYKKPPTSPVARCPLS